MKDKIGLTLCTGLFLGFFLALILAMKSLPEDAGISLSYASDNFIQSLSDNMRLHAPTSDQLNNILSYILMYVGMLVCTGVFMVSFVGTPSLVKIMLIYGFCGFSSWFIFSIFEPNLPEPYATVIYAGVIIPLVWWYGYKVNKNIFLIITMYVVAISMATACSLFLFY